MKTGKTSDIFTGIAFTDLKVHLVPVSAYFEKLRFGSFIDEVR